MGRLKKKGVDITLTEYSDAYHTYDNFRRGQLELLPDAQNTRHCEIAEGDHGSIMNAKTGKPFTLADPCVEKGAHVGYNEAATAATVKAVKDFLTATFKLKPSQTPLQAAPHRSSCLWLKCNRPSLHPSVKTPKPTSIR